MSAPTSVRPFTLPAHRAAWSAQAEGGLNRQTFGHRLHSQGLDDPALRWYLDCFCRDDYGAGMGVVSVWAGVHYFASRHGFSAPHADAAAQHDQDRDRDRDRNRDPDRGFTLPEGKAWLTQRIAQPLQDCIHRTRTVLRVTETRHQVQVLAWDEKQQRLESWQAPRVVLAVPLFVAARLLGSPPDALRQAAALLTYSPWLVADLHLHQRPWQRVGVPPCWDNVVQDSATLGYLDAMHQSLRPDPGATISTLYHALPTSMRTALLQDDTAPWRDLVLQSLAQAHPDILSCLAHIELTRWGHAMAIPRPGAHCHPALLALRRLRSRVRFAHADLAACSVFEEAWVAGCEAAAGPPPA